MTVIRVFVQNEAGSDRKNVHDEKSLALVRSVRVSRPYPYPYGFVLGTSAEDGDNVDCFVVTPRPLRTGTIVACVPVALLEQVEDGEVDHNVLAVPQDEAPELGEIVTDRLVEHFGDVINTEFTARMENDLDSVENGKSKWDAVVGRFHGLFMTDLEKAETDMKSIKANPELTEIPCDKCGSPMAVLYNKRGKFLGCSKYPDCRNTMPVDGPRPKTEVIETDYKCPKCESPMVIREGKRGRFLACTAFPKCKSTAPVDEDGKIIEPKKTGIPCDKCGSEMVVRGSRRGPFLACSAFPKCRNAKPLPEELREAPQETDETCETCGEPMVIKRSRWGKEFLACSGYPKCKNARDLAKPDEETAEAAAEK